MKDTPGCGPCPRPCDGCSTGAMLRALEDVCPYGVFDGRHEPSTFDVGTCNWCGAAMDEDDE